MKEIIRIPVKMDAQTFRSFAYFDTFRLKKRYRSPLIFFVLMTLFAIVCWVVRNRVQSALLGAVLFGIGIGLPLVYLAMFASSVRQQIQKSGLKKPHLVYTLTLSQDGVHIENVDGKEKVELPWKQIYGAYRTQHCIYLYATPQKAFLLPEKQGNVTQDHLFEMLKRWIGERRVQDCRYRAK